MITLYSALQNLLLILFFLTDLLKAAELQCDYSHFLIWILMLEFSRHIPHDLLRGKFNTIRYTRSAGKTGWKGECNEDKKNTEPH